MNLLTSEKNLPPNIRNVAIVIFAVGCSYFIVTPFYLKINGVHVRTCNKNQNSEEQAMENGICKEIVLPEHEDATGTKVCHECGGEMMPCTVEATFHFKEELVKISNIKAYMCLSCAETVYGAQEVKRIEEALRKQTQSEIPKD